MTVFVIESSDGLMWYAVARTREGAEEFVARFTPLVLTIREIETVD